MISGHLTSTSEKSRSRHRNRRQHAGLAAVRVLTDHYREVLLIERDPFGNLTEHRRGVPQGRHAQQTFLRLLTLQSHCRPSTSMLSSLRRTGW